MRRGNMGGSSIGGCDRYTDIPYTTIDSATAMRELRAAMDAMNVAADVVDAALERAITAVKEMGRR